MTITGLCEMLDFSAAVTDEVAGYAVSPKDSNILKFRQLFEIISVDFESMAVLDWVYPGEKKDFAALSDHTTLQRNMKRFLLNGGKVGWAEGKLRGEYT